MLIHHKGATFKRCSNCGSVLPIDQFRPCSTTKDGYQYYCRECHKPSQKPKRKNRQEKICTVCEQQKAYLHFSPTPNSVDGLSDVCRECVARTLKACENCGEVKPMTEFYEARGPDYPDGRFNVCKACDKPHLKRLRPPGAGHYHQYFASASRG